MYDTFQGTFSHYAVAQSFKMSWDCEGFTSFIILKECWCFVSVDDRCSLYIKQRVGRCFPTPFLLAFPFHFVSYATNQMIFFATWQSHSWLTIFSLSHQCGLLNLEIVEGYIAREHADLVLSSNHEAITFMSFGMVIQFPHPLPVILYSPITKD